MQEHLFPAVLVQARPAAAIGWKGLALLGQVLPLVWSSSGAWLKWGQGWQLGFLVL